MWRGVSDEAEDYDDEDDFNLNEYAIDDTLDSLTRLERYHTSDFSLQRLVLVRDLADTAKEAGYQETQRRLLPLLGNFVADSEPAVRQMFVEQLRPLVVFLLEEGGEQGYHELVNTFLPFTVELLVDKNVEVGAAAINALVKIVEFIKPDQVETQLLSVVKSLAHDERSEDYRVVAAQLFNELADKFGEKICRESVVPEMVILTDDMSFSVRKTVASSLGKICKVIGEQQTVDKVFPLYLGLCKDDIWGVRKACAESICALSEAVTSECRTKQMVDVFERFTEDVSRWVRVAAYQQLGNFISTFKSDEVPAKLVRFFTDMAFQGENSTESDLAEYCAYTFPAVVDAIGKQRWNELEHAYSTLVKDVQWKVRKTLSHSLHEVARILGRELTEKHLTTAFDLFIRDLDEVKFGVVTSVSEFLAVLGDEQREHYIPMICQLPTETDNWRLRHVIAKKLGHLAELVRPSVCKGNIVDLTMKLCEDSVFDVRQSCFASAATVLRVISKGDNSDKLPFLNFLLTLPNSTHYQTRQMFVYIAQNMVDQEAKDPSIQCFEADFLDRFVALAEDRVPNVRIVVARALSQVIMKHEPWKSHPKILGAREKLLTDTDPDVMYFANTTTR